MNRFADVISRFAAVVALFTAEELATVRAAFTQARIDQVDPKKPGGPLRSLNLDALLRAVPVAYGSDVRELIRSASDETQLRGREWADAHMAQAILNFCPALGGGDTSVTEGASA